MLGQKNKEIPTEKVIEMQKQGMGNQDIISNLQRAGYRHEQIASAMDQAAVKGEISNMSLPEQTPIEENNDIPLALMNAPSPSSNASQEMPQQPSYSGQENYYQPEPQTNMAPEPLERSSYDAIEEIAESIIKEKWNEMAGNLGNISEWKYKVETDLETVKQEMVRTQQKFDDLQKALMGKVSEYSEGIVNIGTEMKALEKVLEKILSPLTQSVKDLEEVASKLSSKKRTTTTKKKKK